MATPSIDWQASILGLLIGAGTPYQWGEAFITGIGVPPAKTADTDLGNQDGSFAAAEYRSKRIIVCHLEILEDSPTLAIEAFGLIRSAWQPTLADIEFHLQLPGLGHVFYNGRPRELEEDLRMLKSGRIQLIGTFVAGDPQAIEV